MSFQDKYNEYKQKKEARAFFNKNNVEKIGGKDYIIAFFIGLGTSIVLGFVMQWIIFKTHINLSYFSILVGILQALAIKKILNKSGMNLAVVSVVTYMIGILIAQSLYIAISMPVFTVELFMNIFMICLKNLFTGNFLDTIIFLFGAGASYMSLKD